MKIIFEHWQIAYKKVNEEKFKLLKNPSWGWCADPFLVKYKGDIYIFAEIFLYKSERNGVIAYCKYNGSDFSEWTVCMDKHWHLSYPNVFVVDDELYMCPESHQREDVSIYRLVEFPNRWERVDIIFDNVQYVDTTFLEYSGRKYLFTFEPSFKNNGGTLFYYEKEGNRYINKTKITENKLCARPAGNFFYNQAGQLIRVGQKSENSYGEGIAFLKVESVYPTYKERLHKMISVEDIQIDGNEKFCGIHTYNQLDDFQVIDLKRREICFGECISRKRIRKVFVNKY